MCRQFESGLELERSRRIDAVRTVKRSLLVALVLIFFGCLLATIGTELDDAWYRPGSPDPQSGRIFEVVINHGTHVYLTQSERDRLRFVKGPLFAFLLVDFAVIGLWKAFGGNIWN